MYGITSGAVRHVMITAHIPNESPGALAMLRFYLPRSSGVLFELKETSVQCNCRVHVLYCKDVSIRCLLLLFIFYSTNTTKWAGIFAFSTGPET